MGDLDWSAIPAGVWAAVIAAIGALAGLRFSASLAASAESRKRQEAADVQRESDDHNDLLVFRRELQEEGTRRLLELRGLEATVREREKEVNDLRLQLLAERQLQGARVAELERKLELAEKALAACQGALTAIQTKRMEE